MARVTSWRSSRWARWLAWTAVSTAVLSVWGASLFPQSPAPRTPGGEVVFWVVTLGLAVPAFGIGVRFADWSWVIGVLIASVLQMFIVASVLEWPPESGQAGLVLVMLEFLNLLFLVPAGAAGVWWGKRREDEAAFRNAARSDDGSRYGRGSRSRRLW